MVTVIMTIHMKANTKRAITENERSVRFKQLKTLAEVHANAAEVGAKRSEVKEEGEGRGEGWSVE